MMSKIRSFKNKYYLTILNCISASLITISLFIIGYLESTDISVISFFGNSREDFLEQNSKEIERLVFDGKTIRLRTTSETSKFEDFEFFDTPDEQNIVLFLQNKDHIVIQCKKYNYLKQFPEEKVLAYLNQFNGMRTYISEKASLLSKLHQLIIETFYKTPNNENTSSSEHVLPRSVLLFYDQQLNICALKAEQDKSSMVCNETSFFEYVLLPDNIE